MELKITTEANEHGGTDYRLEGDQAFYWWLVNVAGGARDGFRGSSAGATDQSGDQVLLEPMHPLPDQDQNWRSPTARTRIPPTPKPQPVEITVDEAEANPALYKRLLSHPGGVRIVDETPPAPEPEPDTAPEPPPPPPGAEPAPAPATPGTEEGPEVGAVAGAETEGV